MAAPVTHGDIPAIDWHGHPIGEATCAGCAHATLRARGECAPGRSCMQDAYARRIDRFFRTHPRQANQHLAHPYFEVRAIAARHADLFHLAPLPKDPDETVRLQVALRVPQVLPMRLRDDPHREVRVRVALRIAEPELATMLKDADYQVRAIVARRLPMPALWRLTDDPAPEVRRIAAQRLPAPLLQALADDGDWTVRWETAGRAIGAVLERLLGDDEPDVRARARERRGELGMAHG